MLAEAREIRVHAAAAAQEIQASRRSEGITLSFVKMHVQLKIAFFLPKDKF